MMHQMSHHVTTVPILKKLLGYRVLNLEKSILLDTPEDIDEYLSHIAHTRYRYQGDDLVGHNYQQIKELLQRLRRFSKLRLMEHEKNIVNRLIVVTNPYNNRRIKIMGQKSVSFLNYLRQDDYHMFRQITSYIERRQNRLMKKFFD
jgi:hypothetical protein